MSGVASSVIDDKLVLSGGAGEDNAPTDNVYIYYNGLFSAGPSLPIPLRQHCQMTINGTHIIFIGMNGEAFILDWRRQDYIILDEVPVDDGHILVAASLTINSLDQKLWSP